jgi:hypothetical protein
VRRATAISVALLLLTGCGDAAMQPGADDRTAIQQRVATYLRHYAAGEGERACAQFTAALRARSEDRAAASGNRSCAATLTALGPEIIAAIPADRRDEFAARLRDPASVRVELHGDRATAAPAGARARLGLVRQGGRWLIDDLGLPGG